MSTGQFLTIKRVNALPTELMPNTLYISPIPEKSNEVKDTDTEKQIPADTHESTEQS